MKVRDKIMDMGVLEVRSIDWNSQEGCELSDDRDFIVDGFLRLGVGVGNRGHVDSFWAIGVSVVGVIVDVDCAFLLFSLLSICSLKMISAASKEIKGWEKSRR